MPKSHAAIIPKNIFGASPHLRLQTQVSTTLVQAAAMDVAALYERFDSRPEGLSAEQAQVRHEKHGPNVLAKDRRPGIATLLLHAVLNPVVVLLAVLSSVSVRNQAASWVSLELATLAKLVAGEGSNASRLRTTLSELSLPAAGKAGMAESTPGER